MVEDVPNDTTLFSMISSAIVDDIISDKTMKHTGSKQCQSADAMNVEWWAIFCIKLHIEQVPLPEDVRGMVPALQPATDTRLRLKHGVFRTSQVMCDLTP